MATANNHAMTSQSSLKIVSFNMHGFMQGYCVLEELIKDVSPDIILVQEHWLTPANLGKFDLFFPEYFSFGCPAMSECVQTGMLRRRPFGGVMTLIRNNLRQSVETVYCEDRFVIIGVSNYLVVNAYFPCTGSTDRLFIYETTLANISAWRELYCNYDCVIAGDLNTDLDNSVPASQCVNRFMEACSFVRCDVLFPTRKSVTNVNEALKHESCIDYALISSEHLVADFSALDPDIIFF